jgi:hypothetical protein
MDADDISVNNRFETQLRYLVEHPEIDVLGTLAINIGADGEALSLRRAPRQHDHIRRLIWACPVIHPSVMFRKSSIMRIGSYSPYVPNRLEDYELWIRAMMLGLRFHNLQMALLLYRMPFRNKHTLRAAINRLSLGLNAAREFDPRPFSYVALCYPVIRSLLPVLSSQLAYRLASRFDPR